MKFSEAIEVIGFEGSPKHLVGDTEFYAIGTPGEQDPPWFVCSYDGNYQFRNVGDKIEAVILAPCALEEFDSIYEVLEANGFKKEREEKIKVGLFRSEKRGVFCNETHQVTIPIKIHPRLEGFKDSIVFEVKKSQQ